MALDKSYSPANIESNCLELWEKSAVFTAQQSTNHPPFSIQLPPPNVTGSLHMGHAFQQTLMDALSRYHRMRGFNTAWIPGTDHAGIATQIVVDRQLAQKGVSKDQLGREEFLKKIWDWKAESGNTIKRQMQRMGTSVDWSREYFTMDEKLSESVVEVFVRLYEDGLIYRGKRLVNWDPTLLTAVSDLEVVMEETQGSMWYISYPFVDGEQSITDENGGVKTIHGLTIATTRPETMLADGALCVHPSDARYQHLIGKMVELPLCDRQIPIIADEFVDPKFGTGCVKITGAHDFNDYACAIRHQLPLIVIFTPDAHINQNGPIAYQGMDRFSARKTVVEALKHGGYLEKVESHVMMVPKCERTGVVVEPMLTDQWFVATSKATPMHSAFGGLSIAEIALSKVEQGEIQFVPNNWKTTYDLWLNNIQDWCVSRQLWWGHQIPAWYDKDGKVYVARSESEAAKQAGHHQLTRDVDVLDTWFSSALVPFSTLDWKNCESPSNTDFQNFLPSSVLVTGFDIIFFWVARMVMMTTYFTKKVPFHTVYVHGLVRDANGQKMSKSKGNTLDPLDLIDGIQLDALIQKRTTGLMNPKQADNIANATKKEFPNGIDAYGTDALRFTFTSLATHGRNINFDLHRCEGYRNFGNKFWNATRFVLINTEDFVMPAQAVSPLMGTAVDRWMVSILQKVEVEIAQNFSQYRFDLIAQSLYQIVWDEFCDWYLELAKVQLQNPSTRVVTQYFLLTILETLLRLCHPIIPFITEKLWQEVIVRVKKSPDQPDKVTITNAPFPQSQVEKIDLAAEKWMDKLKQLVTSIRTLRSEMNLPPSQRIPIYVETDQTESFTSLEPYVQSLGKVTEIKFVPHLPQTPAPTSTIFDQYRIMLEVIVDTTAEKNRLQKEMSHLSIELEKSTGKLNNPQFKEKAPQKVVDQELSKLKELNNQLVLIKQQIEKMNNH